MLQAVTGEYIFRSIGEITDTLVHWFLIFAISAFFNMCDNECLWVFYIWFVIKNKDGVCLYMYIHIILLSQNWWNNLYICLQFLWQTLISIEYQMTKMWMNHNPHHQFLHLRHLKYLLMSGHHQCLYDDTRYQHGHEHEMESDEMIMRWSWKEITKGTRWAWYKHGIR